MSTKTCILAYINIAFHWLTHFRTKWCSVVGNICNTGWEGVCNYKSICERCNIYLFIFYLVWEFIKLVFCFGYTC